MFSYLTRCFQIIELGEMASRSRYSPVVETVLQTNPKRKFPSVVAPNTTSTQAESEDDVEADTGEESHFER